MTDILYRYKIALLFLDMFTVLKISVHGYRKWITECVNIIHSQVLKNHNIKKKPKLTICPIGLA